MERRLRLVVVGLALVLMGGAAMATIEAWYGTEPGPWKVNSAPIADLPALLNALELQGREPRFVVVAASLSQRANVGCRIIPPHPLFPDVPPQCCFGGPPGGPGLPGGVACIPVSDIPMQVTATHVSVASREP